MTKHESATSWFVCNVFNSDHSWTCAVLRRKTTWARITAFLLLAVFLQAQSTLEPSLVSSNQGATILIQVPRSTTLRTVIAKFCESTTTRCEGTANVPDESVPVMCIKGTWNQVVAELFVGTGLNYVARAPTPSSPGSLLIEKSSRPTQSSKNAAAPFPIVQDTGAETTTSIRSSAEVFDQNSRPEDEEVSLSSTETNSLFQMAGYLPLPDSNGHLVPMADNKLGGLPFGPIDQGSEGGDSTKFLPFPDSHGSRVPIRPPQAGSPFPTGRN
jgi:hypothetical protein